MKHIIIGTAGHVDHGKTTLIEALTGRDTDRLREEKERGISIELGFAPFDLPSGRRAGVVDVPGHERFIKHMLAGVGGFDLVLLVVAADEGVMPQTREHLDILELSGVTNGLIVLNKADLVDADWLELVEEDVHTAVQGTFLEQAPIYCVSALTDKAYKTASPSMQPLMPSRARGRRTVSATGGPWFIIPFRHRGYRYPLLDALGEQAMVYHGSWRPHPAD